MRFTIPWTWLVVAALACGGCVMTADESLWHDAASNGPDSSKQDAPGGDASLPDARPEAALDAPRPEAALDAPRDDHVPDLPTPDQSPCGQMVLQLASTADDGQLEGDEYWHPSGETAMGDIWMGYWGSMAIWGYFRFQLSQALPAGATITAASIELWGHYDFSYAGSGWNPATHALEIFAESSADPPVVTTEKDGPFTPLGRPVTTTAVRWPASGGLSWGPSQNHTSPDIAPVLQEVVTSKGGLASGAHVQLWIRGAQMGDHWVTTAAFGTPSSKPAKLTLSFCP